RAILSLAPQHPTPFGARHMLPRPRPLLQAAFSLFPHAPLAHPPPYRLGMRPPPETLGPPLMRFLSLAANGPRAAPPIPAPRASARAAARRGVTRPPTASRVSAVTSGSAWRTA